MPKAALLQSNFSAGEVSPLVQGRAEVPRYKHGLATCLNYIPALQGPLFRRPGNKYLNAVKDSTHPPSLIPFQFSATQAYMLEFGDGYIRFYANNGQIVTTGTTYKKTAIDTSNPGIQPFIYITTDKNYPTVANDFFYATSTVVAGTALELQSPYAIADVPNIKWAQNADTLYLTHPSYPVYKLQRTGNQLWRIQPVNFYDGPYLPINSYAVTGDYSNATIKVTDVSTAPYIKVEMANSYTVDSCVTDPNGTGQVECRTTAVHGFLTGQKVFIKGVTGTTEVNNADGVTGLNLTHAAYWTIQVVDTTHFLLIGSVFANAFVGNGTVQLAIFGLSCQSVLSGTQDPDQNRNFAVIKGSVRYPGRYITPKNRSGNLFGNGATGFMIMEAGATLPAVATDDAWQFGVFSYGNGFPSCCCFHQDRLAFAGVTNFPQEVDLSETSKYESFGPSAPATLTVSDRSALSFNLASNDANVLRWLKSTTQGLLSGSYVAEWNISPNASSEALTPTNFNAVQTSFFGTANADAIQLGNATLYIQRSSRKVREMNYFFQVGTFRSTDMTELSEHITLPSITKLALQKETQGLLWAIRSDGVLVSMTYDRSDVSITAGWARHILGGKSDASGTIAQIYSFAFIPDPTTAFDQMWMVVKRRLNGSTVYSVEYMTKIFDSTLLQEDAYHFDCGGTYDTYKTVTGITSASPAVVTANAHGFSNGDKVRFRKVIGLDKTTTDINGNTTVVNGVNYQNFLIKNVAANTFELTDYDGNNINLSAYAAYTSGGEVRKLITTISGATWLKNETVSVLTDGGIHPDVVVSNAGDIVLNYPAAIVQFGFKYNSDGKLLRADAGSPDGTAIGKTRRTTRAAFMVKDCADLSIGTEFERLTPVSFQTADVLTANSPTPLFTGLVREGVESAYDLESQVCFRQNSGLPGTILAITSFMDEFDL